MRIETLHEHNQYVMPRLHMKRHVLALLRALELENTRGGRDIVGGDGQAGTPAGYNSSQGLNAILRRPARKPERRLAPMHCIPGRKEELREMSPRPEERGRGRAPCHETPSRWTSASDRGHDLRHDHHHPFPLPRARTSRCWASGLCYTCSFFSSTPWPFSAKTDSWRGVRSPEVDLLTVC